MGYPRLVEGEWSLPGVKIGFWGGFVCINMDPECKPLESFLGDHPQWHAESAQHDETGRHVRRLPGDETTPHARTARRVDRPLTGPRLSPKQGAAVRSIGIAHPDPAAG